MAEKMRNDNGDGEDADAVPEDEATILKRQLMGRKPRTKKKRPKSEQSGDEDFKPGEDHIGNAMAAKAADLKRKKVRAETLKKRKREKELEKVVDDAEKEGDEKIEIDEFLDKEAEGGKKSPKKREVKAKKKNDESIATAGSSPKRKRGRPKTKKTPESTVEKISGDEKDTDKQSLIKPSRIEESVEPSRKSSQKIDILAGLEKEIG